MRRESMILAFLIALSLAAAADAQPADETAPPVTNRPAITVSTVVEAPLVERVYASGLIGPVERVLVQPLIEGQAIETIEAEVGDRVAAGQVLARLSDAALVLQRSQLAANRASAEASIAQSEAQLVEAEALRDQALRDRDRAARLADQGATTTAAADEARSNADAARARVTAASQGLNAARAQLSLVEAQTADTELQLRRTSVVAPVAGDISARRAMVGAIASLAGEALFEIVRDGALELRADVAEQDVLALAPGQTAQIRLAGLRTPIEGKIRLVEPTVDETTRLGRVRIAILDSDRVRAGMFADAEIRVRAAETLAVPGSAIGGDSAGASVLRVRDGVVERVPVVTGIRDGGMIEILEGLDAGDTIVTKAGAFVRDGDRINPVPAPAAGGVN